MEQRGLGGGRVMMDARREEAQSGAMVASMAGLTRVMRISALKMALWYVGGDGFCSVCRAGPYISEALGRDDKMGPL